MTFLMTLEATQWNIGQSPLSGMEFNERMVGTACPYKFDGKIVSDKCWLVTWPSGKRQLMIDSDFQELHGQQNDASRVGGVQQSNSAVHGEIGSGRTAVAS